jgi:ribosomal protein S27E
MIEKIFNGRNGIDSFSIFLIAVAMLFVSFKWALIISIILIAYALFRCFSRNIVKRQGEQRVFQAVLFATSRFFVRHTVGIRKFLSLQSLRFKNRKTTLYIKCPKCKKVLSLPRNKGKLAVTCTVCGHKFIKKT